MRCIILTRIRSMPRMPASAQDFAGSSGLSVVVATTARLAASAIAAILDRAIGHPPLTILQYNRRGSAVGSRASFKYGPLARPSVSLFKQSASTTLAGNAAGQLPLLLLLCSFACEAAATRADSRCGSAFSLRPG